MNVKDELSKGVNLLHRSLFEVSKGRVGGRIMGMPVLVLRTTGRKTGKQRATMLTTPVRDGDTIVLVGSNGGDDREPMWVRNLRADPKVEVTIDGATRPMQARVASSDERAPLWPRVTSSYAGYAGYQKNTDREIPLVILEPR